MQSPSVFMRTLTQLTCIYPGKISCYSVVLIQRSLRLAIILDLDWKLHKLAGIQGGIFRLPLLMAPTKEPSRSTHTTNIS